LWTRWYFLPTCPKGQRQRIQVD